MRNNHWLIFALTVGVLALATSAWGQDNCVAGRAVGQAYLGFETPLNEGDTWGGGMYLTLGGQEFLEGIFSGQDGTDVWNGQNGLMGKGKGGSYTFAFNQRDDGSYADSFTTQVTNAVFPNPPGKVGFGYYQAAHKIVSGTGRFRNASGNIVVAGTYVFFPWAGGNAFGGRWNPDVSGKICSVDPPAQP
jgi:hypothetical protein